MANIMLQNIEANQYAKIQLRANSRVKVTEQSFMQKVRFNYVQLPRLTSLYDELPSIFARSVKRYIDACLARGEQVAVLAFTRRDIAKIRSILEAQYPGKTIVSLVPDKMYNETIMSTFIKKYWNGMRFVPQQNMVQIICSEIMSKLQYITYNAQKSAPRVQDFLIKWAREQGPTINSWVNQFMNGQMSQTALLDNVKTNMLQFEISSNAVKQALLSDKNQQNKQNAAAQSADFLLSTIHSAKGLEFDNVIILYRNENDMDEEKKRMYYVALTRAMKSEYILAYDTMVSPQIESDYITVLKDLHAIAPAPNSPFNFQGKKKPRIKI